MDNAADARASGTRGTRRRPAGGRLLRQPFESATWVQAGYLLAALPIGWILTALTAVALVPWLLAAAAAVLLPGVRVRPGSTAVWLAPVLAAGMAGAAVERVLARAVLGAPVPRPRPTGGRPTPTAWLAGTAADPEAWREAAYVALLVPLGVVWAAPLVGLAFAGTLLSWSFWAGPQERLALWTLSIPIDTPARRLLSVIAGLAFLLLVAPLIRWLSGARARLARRLLGPGHRVDLAVQLAEQHAMREAAVRAHTTDTRRIERDLHDGAQASLTALIMDLGRARKKLASDPHAAQALVDGAYQAARQALAELRDLARGIQPPILTDRGLDAAVSALTARTPFPVEVDIDVPVRPPAPVESAAYFIVAEALANVTKHARASRAYVRIAPAGGGLVVEVADDGVGGALPDAGTGLAGLTDRAAALDGRLTVASPPGGPTTVRAELPCGW
jgi:signal transduction histidine kinase